MSDDRPSLETVLAGLLGPDAAPGVVEAAARAVRDAMDAEAAQVAREKDPRRTRLAPDVLRELRAGGRTAEDGPFVDPFLVYQSKAVLVRRGEVWASSVLGRDLSERAAVSPSLPYLVRGEMWTLVAADRREDAVAFEGIVGE